MGEKMDKNINEPVQEEVDNENVEAEEIEEENEVSGLQGILQELQKKYPDLEINEQLTVIVPTKDLLQLIQDLKDNYGFNYLTNITAADYLDQGKFEIIYNINSIGGSYDVMLKTAIDRNKPVVPSITSIWGSANWQEREVYDMFGIVFTGHPNLKRILLYDSFEGHPLRKDYVSVGGR